MNYTGTFPPATSLSQREEVEGMPGVRVNEDVFGGPIDSFSEACRILGVKAPVHPKSMKLITIDSSIPLFPFQEEGVRWMTEKLRLFNGVICADDMGLGKTRQSLVVARALSRNMVVVVCPASVRPQWVEQALMTGFKKVVALVPGEDPEKLAATEPDVVVTSFELVKKLMGCASFEGEVSTVIIDEAHRLMGRKGSAFSALKELCAYATYRMALTGTPVWSEPRDLWAQLELVLPGRFGHGFMFDVRYCNGHHGLHGFVNKGVSNSTELQRRLKFYMLRRTKAEVASQLPELTRTVRWVEGTAAAKHKLSMMMSGANKDRTQEALKATLEAKLPVAVDLAHEAKQFVLFTWKKSHAHEMTKKLNDRGTLTFCITGESTPERRRAIVKEAIERKAGVVCTLGAASTGVDGLQQVSSNGICHALSWVANEMMQMESRIHRMGQTRGTVWTYLCMRDSADEWVHSTVVRRLGEWRQLMESEGDGTVELRTKLMNEFAGSSEDDAAVLRALFADAKDEGPTMYDYDGDDE